MADEIILYRTEDGKNQVNLMSRDGMVWLNQSQMAELFATSKQNIAYHISNILEDNELSYNAVVKEYLTTALDGKNYKIKFYSLEMIMAVGFRVRSPRGVQFRQWANTHLTSFLQKVFSKNGEKASLARIRTEKTLRNLDVLTKTYGNSLVKNACPA